ncbi:hypothetical protein [Actinoplanes sp. NPDC051851]|uniref:Fur family transcriptional regulator n=1 Tax=Actinoplanes sp. NPDC051851 TaxID=3154753 RepID=UPI00341475BE
MGARGFRRTAASRAVLAVLQGSRGMTARAIHDRLIATGETCDIVTVHRVLRRLSAAGVAYPVPCGSSVGYRLAGPQDPVLQCVRCGVTTPLSGAVTTALAREADQAGFTVGPVVTGHCPDCRRRA